MGNVLSSLLAKRLYRLSTVEQYIVKLVIRYNVFDLVKVCRICKFQYHCDISKHYLDFFESQGLFESILADQNQFVLIGNQQYTNPN